MTESTFGTETTTGEGVNFFSQPILNSPYEYPSLHWELDADGQPTLRIIADRRSAKFVTAVPKPRKQKGKAKQAELNLDEGYGLSTEDQKYDPTSVINRLREYVDRVSSSTSITQ